MKLQIEEVPLKQLLSLFNPEDEIDLIELGDTWHPSDGFVDESILGEVEHVSQIIDANYDFDGLVYFEAVVNDVKIVYSDELYTLKGDRQELDKILSKLKASSAISDSPNYNYRLIN